MNRWFYILTLTLCVFYSKDIAAQEYTVTVTNRSGATVSGAHIMIVDTLDRVAVWESLSDSLGRLILPSWIGDNDSLAINIMHLDYRPYTHVISSLKFPLTVVLEDITYELDEAVVTGQAPVRLFDKGDIIVDVKQMKNADRLNADQALRRIPGVTLRDEGIQLYGTNAEVYINGIRQSIGADAVIRYLHSLPAHAIESIRLIPMPSNKYGKARAVIDINLKTSMPDGLSSQSQLSGGMLGLMPGNFGVNEFLMLKKGRVTFNTLLSYDNYNQWAEKSDSSYFVIPDRYITAGNYNYGRLGAITSSSNLTVDLSNRQTLDVNIFIYWDHEHNSSRWNDIEGTSSTNARTEQAYRSSARGNDDMYSLSAKYSTDQEKQHSFSAYYSWMYGSLKDRGKYYSEQNETGSWQGYLSTDYAMRGHQHFIQTDAVSKFGEYLELDYGVRSSLGFLTDDTYNCDFETGESIGRSNFKGHEIITGAYARIKYNITENHGLSLDAGYDHTWFRYMDGSSSFDRQYGDFMPKFTYWLNIKNYNLSVNAYTYIQRPHYTYLLPGMRYINDYLYSIGNPAIDNQKQYIAIINQTFFGFLGLNFVYARSYGAIEKFYGYDAEMNSVYTKYANLYNYDMYKIQLNCPYVFLNEKIYGNLFLHYEYVNAFNINSEAECGDNAAWHVVKADLSFYYDITDRLTLNIIASYHNPWKNRIQLNTDRHQFSIDGGLSYAFLKNKNLILDLNIASISPVWEEINSTYAFAGNTFNTFSKKLTSATLSIRYNFSLGHNIKYRDNRGNFERMMK